MSRKLIYKGRNEVYLDADAGEVTKEYAVPSFPKSLIYGWLRRPKSERAYAHGLRLRALGIDTPEPLSHREEYNSLHWLGRSEYVCRYSAGRTLWGVEEEPWFGDFAPALAAFVLELHRKGIFMKDLSPGNVLFERGDDGRFHFQLVDINRMAFGVAAGRMRGRNFRALMGTPEGNAAVVHQYVILGGAPPSFEAEAAEAYRRFRRNAGLRHRLKRVLLPWRKQK